MTQDAHVNEIFHIFRRLGANNTNGQQVIAYEILSFASLCCMEQKPIDPHQTSGIATTLMNVNDEWGIERLMWGYTMGCCCLASCQNRVDIILGPGSSLEHFPSSTRVRKALNTAPMHCHIIQCHADFQKAKG